MKIICIGRNYMDHAKELNNPVPQQPLFFLKPDSALLTRNRPFFYPPFSEDIHYELEVVLKINRLGKHIQEKFAHKYFAEVALGVDFTARDLQQRCKEKGHPWEIAKAFDNSAAVSRFVTLAELKQPDNLEFRLDRNGQPVQHGQTADMIFSVHRLIAYVSQFMTLRNGDLIFTGTPAGVGPVALNDHLEGYLEGRKLLDFRVK